VEQNSRELSWDGCVNVRDLGGLGRIRLGAVVRMEQPKRLTEAGWAAAWAYGVRTFVDLRGDEERESDPDRALRPVGIATVHVPQDPVGTPFYEYWSEFDGLASPLYFPAMLAEYPQRVVSAVRAIANAAPGCVVFHCAGGKDRTGLLALVLLTLAGGDAGGDHPRLSVDLRPDEGALRRTRHPRPAHRRERVAREPQHHHRSITDLDDHVADDAGFPPPERSVRHRTRRAAHPPDHLKN